MTPVPKLLDFFRNEFQKEEQSGFARLKRVPDSHVMATLRYYMSLDDALKVHFVDCCAYWAHARYGFVVNAARFDHTQHPFFSLWSRKPFDSIRYMKSVPILRSMVSQYKIDMHRGVPSTVTKEDFNYASSICSIKAPELRKRVKAALTPLGYHSVDQLGYYCCRKGKRDFKVHVDHGGRLAQLRYVVSRPEFTQTHPLSQFSFEAALGCGFGDWNFIVEENVDEVFALFGELITYSFELPDRIRAAVSQGRRPPKSLASKSSARQLADRKTKSKRKNEPSAGSKRKS